MCSKSFSGSLVGGLLATAALCAQPFPPELELLQPLPSIELPDTARFATVTVLFRNRGGQLLQLRAVRSECWCATVSVQRGGVPPDSLGILRVMVTAAGLGDEREERLRFTIESNACNSPLVFELPVRRR
ncbi:hypothetical protein HRbin21_01240 [bacterium HR21]|nr:hypothetical protein HRbin21_01240 [bacterium HR21]